MWRRRRGDRAVPVRADPRRGRPGVVEALSAAGWSARSPTVSMSGRTAGWSGSRARRWMSGSARIVTAGSRRSFPQPRVVPLRTPAGMLELAFALKRERPERTAAQVREIMLATAGEGDHVPGLRTLQTHLARAGAERPRGRPLAGEGLWPLRSRPRATSCGPGTGCTAPSWPARRRGGRCCWRSSMITPGCWSGGGGAPARTCSAWRPRCAPG